MSVLRCCPHFFLRQDLSPCGSQASVCLCLTDAGITLTCHRGWLLCGGSGYGVPVFARQASTLLNKKGASMIRTMSLFGHEGFLESLFRMLGSGCAHSSWVQCLPRILKALDSTLSTEKKKNKNKQTPALFYSRSQFSQVRGRKVRNIVFVSGWEGGDTRARRCFSSPISWLATGFWISLCVSVSISLFSKCKSHLPATLLYSKITLWDVYWNILKS